MMARTMKVKKKKSVEYISLKACLLARLVHRREPVERVMDTCLEDPDV
jgi:hypothetical protein